MRRTKDRADKSGWWSPRRCRSGSTQPRWLRTWLSETRCRSMQRRRIADEPEW